MDDVAVPSSAELRHEHRVILGVLSALEKQLAAASHSGTVPATFLRDVIEFGSQFIDRCHHGKEERCLFPCLQRRGMTPEGGLLAVLLEEHATGRDLVRRISSALDRYERGEAPVSEVLDPGRAYADLLRQHIIKEDDVLFPVGDELMAAMDHETVRGCYGDREAEFGAGKHDHLEHLAHRLTEADA